MCETLTSLSGYPPDAHYPVLSAGGVEFRVGQLHFRETQDRLISNPRTSRAPGGTNQLRRQVNYFRQSVPIHLTFPHLTWLCRQKEPLFLAEKADGVPVYQLPSDISPRWNIPKVEAEYIPSLDLYLVFEVCPQWTGIQSGSHRHLTLWERMNYLRQLHPFAQEQSTEESLTFPQAQDLLREDAQRLHHFLQSCGTGPKWWPKLVWKMESSHLWSFLHETKGNLSKWKSVDSFSAFPTDGWIITPLVGQAAKWKPPQHTTVDLLFEQGMWWWKKDATTARGGQRMICSSPVAADIHVEKSSIWRCYWHSSYHSWIPREKRSDKKKPNNEYLVKHLTQCHQSLIDYTGNSPYWKLPPRLDHPPYYQLLSRVLSSHSSPRPFQQFLRAQSRRRDSFFHYFLQVNKTSPSSRILDIGCGKYQWNWTQLEVVGLEIDPALVWKKKQSHCGSRDQRSYQTTVWCDFCLPWTWESQRGRHRWMITYERDFLVLEGRTFDYIVSNHSLSYANQSSDQLTFVLEEITRHSHEGTLFLIQYINLETMTRLFRKRDCNGNSPTHLAEGTVQLLDSQTIQLHFPCHEHSITERPIRFSHLNEELHKRGWELIPFPSRLHSRYQDFQLPSEHPWASYQKTNEWLLYRLCALPTQATCV